MKKSSIILNIIVTILLITLFSNVGELMCQDKSIVTNTQYQAEYIDKISHALNDENAQNDKNIVVRIIELAIKHNLNSRYQRMESEELEEMLDKRR